MAFFMVMFALSQVDAKKFKSLSISLGQAFNSPGISMINTGVGSAGSLSLLPKQPRPKPVAPPDPNGTRATRPKYMEIKEVMDEFMKLVKASGLEGSVTVTTNRKGDKLMVRLSDSLLFPAGSAELTEESRMLMDKVAAILVLAGRPVRIEGHTDNLPPKKGGRYPTNWHLSAERATNVLMYLVTRHGMPPELLEAGGRGEYWPVSENDTVEGRAKNRRVEFVVLGKDEVDDSFTEETFPEDAEPLTAESGEPTLETSVEDPIALPSLAPDSNETPAG